MGNSGSSGAPFARSRGPLTEAGKARSARNGTKHGLRGGPFALLPGEESEAFAEIHAAVAADWGPRENYERRWVMELVTSLGVRIACAACNLRPLPRLSRRARLFEATMKRLVTFARYGVSMLTVSSPKVLDEKSPPDSEVRQSRRVQAAVALGVVPFVAGL